MGLVGLLKLQPSRRHRAEAPARSRSPMPTPLHLTDEELRQLLELAEPVAYGQRREFLRAVAGELAACPQPGPGATYRIARDVQRRFVLTSQRIAPERESPWPRARQDSP
jgi:hypothetical protein